MMAPLAELLQRDEVKPARQVTKGNCPWCGPKDTPKPGEMVSHGICAACRERLLDQS